MAANSDGKVRKLKPTDETNKVKEHLRKISAQKQRASDEGMALAALYKEAEEDGMNRAALKMTHKLISQDEQKSRVFLEDLMVYLSRAGFLAKDVELPFAQGGLDLVTPAA